MTRAFWEKAYLENAPRLLGMCMRYVDDRAVAEDLLHDGFLTAIGKSSEYAGKGPFEAWLRRVVLNTVLMHLRRRKAEALREALYMADAEEEAGAEHEDDVRSLILGAGFTREELLVAASLLPGHHRLVFNLYVMEQFTHEEIGKELGISPGTSKSHLARARKKLRQILQEKALEKQPEKKKKVRAAMLLALADSDFIDQLYRRQLEEYTVAPADQGAAFLDQVAWNRQAMTPSSPSLKRSVLWIAGTAAFLAATVTGAFFFSTRPVMTPQVNSQPAPTDTATQKVVSPPSVPTDSAVVSHQGTPQELTKKEPVVIRQTVVRHTTITLRDTVRISDTTHAE